MKPKFPKLLLYRCVNILDIPSANLKQHFKSSFRYIKDAIDQGGCVLVHCYAGVSRSATIVIGYLMQEHGMSLKEAIKHVKKIRNFIHPNEGFYRQLLQFQKELLKAKSNKIPENINLKEVTTDIEKKDVRHESTPKFGVNPDVTNHSKFVIQSQIIGKPQLYAVLNDKNRRILSKPQTLVSIEAEKLSRYSMPPIDPNHSGSTNQFFQNEQKLQP